MALDPDATIFEGVWTDWSRGRIWGLTWTLHPTKAVIFTNCMALFVTLFGAQLWTITRYVLHQMAAPKASELATPHLGNQQVILRNASGGLSTARLMLKLAWKSRRSTGKRSKRSWTIGLIAILYAILVMAVELFSSKVISPERINGGAAVLSRSKHCGIWNETYYAIASSAIYGNDQDLNLFVQFTEKRASEVQLSYEYAQECYLSQPSSNKKSSTCNSMRVPRITWQNRDTACPFEPQMCHNGAKAILLDTGYIDTHDDLGINASPNDRLKYRRVTTCAVLNGTDRVRGWDGQVLVNSSTSKPSPESAFAFFGPSLYKQTDYTYSLSNFASFRDNFTAQVTNPYQLDTEMAWGPADPVWSTSDFDPISELAQQGDLALLFLSFSGMYIGQVDDPWFSAHSEHNFDVRIPFLQTRYARDSAISTLGCTEQHQFCTDNTTCTAMLGFDQVQNNNTFNAVLSAHQNATFDRVLRTVAVTNIRNVVEFLALTTTPVLASSSIASGSSGAVISRSLPEDQWRIELQYWHSVAMAYFQRSIVQWATGQIAPEPQYVQYLLPPETEQDIWFCKSLVVPSLVFQSFSIVAIVIIFVIGLLVIFASLNIERLALTLHKCRGKRRLKKGWDEDYILGVERLSDRSGNPSPEKDLDNLGLQAEYRDSSNFSWEKLPPLAKEMETLDRDHLPGDARSRDPKVQNPSAETQYQHTSPKSPPRPPRYSWMALSVRDTGPSLPQKPTKVLNADNERRFSRFTFRSHPKSSLRSSMETYLNGRTGSEGNWI